LGAFLSEYTDTRAVGGLATGRGDFGGRDVRSAVDVTARGEGRPAPADAAPGAGLRPPGPFVLPGRGGGARVGAGRPRGVLSRGVFRIDRLALIGRLARLHIEGTVTLQERLDLDVVAATNPLGIDPACLRLLNLRLPAVGPIPLSLVNEVSNYLSNR